MVLCSSPCMVLHKVMSEITANSVCADLSYHAWYLDDGVLAGPQSAVLQALFIIQEIGPPIGLIINFHKCEIFSKHDVIPFPLEMKRSTHPNIVILGIPIGDKAFHFGRGQSSPAQTRGSKCS